MKRLLLTVLVISFTTLRWVSADPPTTTQPESTDTLLMGDVGPGKVLHDKSCTICHISMFGGDGSKIYTRQNRKVMTIEGLMARVELCNKNVGTHFDKTQIDDVVKYLSDEFYKFSATKETETVEPEKNEPKMVAPK
ncbi:MAG TPA: hypothetical protein ENI80_02195 [Acidiferrobacteraceae bacterium]|nr:hypothetical protein [Acidiferrobacteraceae bacterium]